jgi:hypothetical protein
MDMIIRPNFARQKTSLSPMDLTYTCFSKCPISRVWPQHVVVTCNLWVQLLQVKKNYMAEYRHSLHSTVLIFKSINISSMQFSPFLFLFLGGG